MAGLRAYLRQRERLLDYAAAHIQHMQKALMQMNLQLHHVVSDITGATGMRIIRAIVSGERDPTILASYRDVRCHSSVETVRRALVGNDREEHIFALTQGLELYDVYQTKVAACDKKIEAILRRLKKNATPPVNELPPPRRRTRQPNAPALRSTVWGPTSRSSWSWSAGPIYRHGRARSTSHHGWRSPLTIRFPGGRCCRRKRGAPAIGPRHCYGLPP